MPQKSLPSLIIKKEQPKQIKNQSIKSDEKASAAPTSEAAVFSRVPKHDASKVKSTNKVLSASGPKQTSDSARDSVSKKVVTDLTRGTSSLHTDPNSASISASINESLVSPINITSTQVTANSDSTQWSKALKSLKPKDSNIISTALKITKADIRKTHQWFFTIGGGTNQIQASGLGQMFNGAMQAPAGLSSNNAFVGTPTVVTPLPAPSQGHHILFGLGYRKLLSSRWRINASLHYQYLWGNQETGSRKDSIYQINNALRPMEIPTRSLIFIGPAIKVPCTTIRIG